MSGSAHQQDAEQMGVRFASHHEEIAPNQSEESEQGERSLHAVQDITGAGDGRREDLNPDAIEELQQLRTTLQNNIQSARMQHHAFEPVSLPGSQPASRIPSGSATPSKRHFSTGSGTVSPRHSPPTSTVQSPPLTPAATKSRDGRTSLGSVPGFQRPVPDVMTPQRSASPQADHSTAKPESQTSGVVSSYPKPPTTTITGSTGSQPQSADQSLAATPASTAPGTPRPFTPTESASESLARNKRLSQARPSSADAQSQYRFGNRDPSIGYSSSGSANTSVPSIPSAATLPRSSASGVSLHPVDNKRHSLFGGLGAGGGSGGGGEAKKEHDEKAQEKESHAPKSNLKRFFKFGSDHKHKDKSHANGTAKDGTKTPPVHRPSDTPAVPFADDHGLQSKYGKFGKILGSGAGGSVRLMKRTGDGVVFAVKQFRDRHAYESEKEYNKKVTSEFCIGSTLHHGNVIETIDIVHEKGKWYEVMEYAPFDLFATVMTGKMGKEEITCATLQILSGVCYLHSMGLAHRDLKLDNVVINDKGIMKLIDFGSAVVFRYPFENDIVKATGVVGSDPYLAPEVYDQSRYDPRPADVWSIAIIFCCMTLRRFPWKAPRISDNSYRLFISPPDPDQDRLLDARRKSSAVSSKRSSVAQPSRNSSDAGVEGEEREHHHHHHHHHRQSTDEGGTESVSVSRQSTQSETPTIKGPLRLLRLLPRETRHIIGRMLELDPDRRADVDEILHDPWVMNSLVCRQEEDNRVIMAPNHTHTLQPSNAGK